MTCITLWIPFEIMKVVVEANQQCHGAFQYVCAVAVPSAAFAENFGFEMVAEYIIFG